MASVGKKLHHTVPRFYLKAWAKDDSVYCLQQSRIFRANTRNVGAENHFYRLNELSPEDASFVRELAISQSPANLRPLHEDLLRTFSLPHVVRRHLQDSGKATPELIAEVDNVIAEMNENLHTSIEEQFKPYLDSMLGGDVSFYADPTAGPLFFRGIATQYLRTNWTKRARDFFGPDKLPLFQRIANVLVHIYATNLGYALYADRERYTIILLENKSAVEFITGDQPVINISAKPKERTPPEKFELYYPLSPNRAMMLLEACSKHRPSTALATATSAHVYNLHVGARCFQQIFCAVLPRRDRARKWR